MTERTERQLRAYIFGYTGAILVVSSAPGDPRFLQVTTNLRNFGQTPATDYRHWIKIEVGDPDKPPFEKKGVGAGKTIVAPTTEPTLVASCPVSDDELRAIQNGAKRVFVWGAADYKDVFGEERYFKFYNCNGRPIPGGGWFMDPSDKRHEAN
jgi:hypothetical protein